MKSEELAKQYASIIASGGSVTHCGDKVILCNQSITGLRIELRNRASYSATWRDISVMHSNVPK